jgi:hypothetical protein
MGVRYRNTFYSHSGVGWKIDIHDSTYSSLVNTFTSEDGFRLSYKQVTERLDPIFSSTVSIPIHVIDYTIEAFLVELMTAQEERFSVKIYKFSTQTNTYLLEWAGVLLADMISKEDISYPFVIELTFTDGLGRLNDIDYNTGGSAPAKYNGKDTILTHLLRLLEKTGSASMFENYELFLQTTVAWYDVRHLFLYTFCPLAYTKIDNAVFYTYTEEGTLSYMKCNKVLEMILRLFNARIFISEGKWHVIQVQEYGRATSMSRVFTKIGTYGGSYSGANAYMKTTQSNAKRSVGGLTKYFAPLKKVLKTYKYKRSSYSNNSILPLPIPLYSSTAIALLSNVLSTDRIKFSGTIRTWYQATGGTITTDLWSQFYLRITATKLSDSTVIYLTNTDDVYKWHPTPASCVYKVGPYQGGSQWDEEFPIEFTLPILTGVEYSATFQFYYNGLYRGPGFAYTLQAGESWQHEIDDFKLVVDNSDGEALFTAENTSISGLPVSSNLELKMPDIVLGDGPLATSLGRLRTFGGLAEGDSTLWSINNSINKYKINQLSVNQNMMAQRIPVEKYQGTWIDSTITAYRGIVWGGKILVPLSLNINPVTDEASGEWFNAVVTVMGGGTYE